MEKLKILIVAGSGRWGGGESWLVNVIRRHRRDRFVIHVVSPEEGELFHVLKGMGITAWVIRTSHLAAPVIIFRLIRLMKRERYSIVTSHGARSNFYARVASRLAGVPVNISYYHCSIRSYPIHPMKKRLYLLLDRMTARLSDHIVCIAGYLREELVKDGIPGAKVVAILNGIDTAEAGEVSPTMKKEMGLERAYPVVLTAGRFVEEKGLTYLLKAAPILRRSLPGLKIVLAGDGPLRASLEEEARSLSIEEMTLFLGMRDDIPALLSLADMAVLPSLSEGMPLFVMEAMSAGRPVVSTMVGGTQELVRDGVDGLLVPPRDPRFLAEAIRRLAEDQDLAKRMGESARRRIVEGFTIERMVSEIEELYETAVKDKPLAR